MQEKVFQKLLKKTNHQTLNRLENNSDSLVASFDIFDQHPNQKQTHLMKFARKLVKKIDNDEKINNPIKEKDMKDLLGVQKFNYGEIEEENRIGVVMTEEIGKWLKEQGTNAVIFHRDMKEE